MTDYLLCCFYFNRQSNQQHSSGKFGIRHIDKSMIGLPTNFQHCAHIGCSDVISNSLPIQNRLSTSNSIESQMKSKGVLMNNQQLQQQQQQPQQPLVSHLKLIDLNVS